MAIYTPEQSVDRFNRLVESKAPGQLSDEAYYLGHFIAIETCHDRNLLDMWDLKQWATNFAGMDEPKFDACLSELVRYGLVDKFFSHGVTYCTVQTYDFTSPALSEFASG